MTDDRSDDLTLLEGRSLSRSTERTAGPVWDAVEGRAPLPKAAATLGLEGLEGLDVDGGSGTIELAFTAIEDWTNPSGNILAGFVAAMLYDTVGPALLATVEPDEFQSTLQLNVTFLRPVRPGRLIGRGSVVHRHGDIVALEATLFDGDSVVVVAVAVASATAVVIPLATADAAV